MSLNIEEIEKNLMIHLVHTYADFHKILEEDHFESMQDVWESFVAFQVAQLEKARAKKGFEDACHDTRQRRESGNFPDHCSPKEQS